MTALEFNKALADLGMTTLEAAKWLGVGKSSTHRYSTGHAIPGPVDRALRLACGVFEVEPMLCRALKNLEEVGGRAYSAFLDAAEYDISNALTILTGGEPE